MTREEAIKIIKECKEKGFKYTFHTVDKYHAALEIAIKALENENVVLDKVLEIIDQMDKENEECNDDPSRWMLRIEHQDFREMVLALKGGEQE